MRIADPHSLTRHADRLYRAAWGLCGSPHYAEDLVQETFARVLLRPRVLRGEEDLSYREASRALEVPETTITTRLFRARRRVAARLSLPAVVRA
jgi:RNA polymerase sigma-70 factor, ECF subfamily